MRFFWKKKKKTVIEQDPKAINKKDDEEEFVFEPAKFIRDTQDEDKVYLLSEEELITYEDPYAVKNFRSMSGVEYEELQQKAKTKQGKKQTVTELFWEYFLPFSLTCSTVYYIYKGRLRSNASIFSAVLQAFVLDVLRLSIIGVVYYIVTYPHKHYLFYPALYLMVFYVFSFFAFTVVTSLTRKGKNSNEILEKASQLNIDLSFFYFEFLQDEDGQHKLSEFKKVFQKKNPLYLEADYMYPGTVLVDHCLRIVSSSRLLYRVLDWVVIIILYLKCGVLYYIYYYVIDTEYIEQIEHVYVYEVMLMLGGLSIFMYANFKKTQDNVGILVNNDLIRKADGLGRLTNIVCRLKNEEYPIDKEIPTINVFSSTSLECWDNCRRLILEFGKGFQEQEDLKITIMGIYVLWLIGMLFFVNASGVQKYINLQNDLPYYIMYTDIFALVIPILLRLLHGAYVNLNFKQQKKQILMLKGIYQDLMNSVDLYWRIDKSQILNPFYKTGVEVITQKCKRVHGKMKVTQQVEVVSEYAEDLTNSADKIIEQIEFDSEEHSIKFLGLISSTFELFETAIVASFPILLGVVSEQLSKELGY